MQVLVVEDDESNSIYIREVLIGSGVKSIHAGYALEALHIFEEKHQQIDIVIMDLRLPGMNGLEAARRMKAINRDVPIIAITAYVNYSSEKEAYSSGCSSYLTKPFMPLELMEHVNKVCDTI